MHTNQDIESMLVTARQVFEAAQHIVDGMKEGDRVQIKDLAKGVGSAMAADPKEVLGLVNLFVHKTTAAYVTRGKNGGLVKGTRPAKVVKASKKDTVPTVTDVAAVTADNS